MQQTEVFLNYTYIQFVHLSLTQLEESALGQLQTEF